MLYNGQSAKCCWRQLRGFEWLAPGAFQSKTLLVNGIKSAAGLIPFCT